MQPQKSQPSGQLIVTKLNEPPFPALSVYPRDWISQSAPETNARFYLSLLFLVLHVAAHCINIVQFTVHHNDQYPAVDPSYDTDKVRIFLLL